MATETASQRRRRTPEPGAVDLLEQAFHSLRTASLPALAAYAIGTIPFVLAALYYWADMTHSPFARARCASGAWALCFLYLWMRCWQAIFCSNLRARLRHEQPMHWTPARIARVFMTQLIWAPIGFVALFASMLVLIPYGWVYAWHQNLVALHDRETLRPGEASRRARQLAMLWPRQNHLAISAVTIFRFTVFLSLLVLVAQLPGLAKSLLGIDSAFTQSMYWLTNTTFLATVVGLTHLCIDPLVKAIYVIRCHYGESLRTGEDLLAELSHLRAGSAAALAAALLLILTPSVGAKTPPAQPVHVEAQALTAKDLNTAIETVMQRREYVWRLPRELLPEVETHEKNIIERFADGLADFSRRVFRAIGNAVGDFVRWLEKKLHLRDRRPFDAREPDEGWMTGLNVLTWFLFGVVCLALAWMLFKAWRRAGPRVAAAELEALQPVIDVADENVLASQLPEDEWIAMAERLRREGDWRKAMRAYFLALLAWLGRRELVEIRKSKSNRDYARELDRRARRMPAVLPVFADHVVRFERSWYGRDAVTEADLDETARNLRSLRAQEPTHT